MTSILQRSVKSDVPNGMRVEEWNVRCDLAACYQLTDMYGMSDLAGTHISARVPGGEEHFLLNPYGWLFDEITASSLIKVDVKGNVISGPKDKLNFAGFVIHSAIHIAKPEFTCVMHSHTTANNGVAMQRQGLLPISQKALVVSAFLTYHDFEGAALNLDERESIVRDLGEDNRVMLLRNHGALTVGRSIGEAFCWMFFLEQACRQQIAGLSGGCELNGLSPEVVTHTKAQSRKILSLGGSMEQGFQWPALLRKLERERGTSYRA